MELRGQLLESEAGKQLLQEDMLRLQAVLENADSAKRMALEQ